MNFLKMPPAPCALRPVPGAFDGCLSRDLGLRKDIARTPLYMLSEGTIPYLVPAENLRHSS